YALGATTAGIIRAENHKHALQGVAMRVGHTGAFVTLDWPLPPSQDLAPRLRALGHYPFTDEFSLGCAGPGLGSTLDLDAMKLLPTPQESQLGQATAEILRSDTRSGGSIFYGWITEWRDPSRCVLVVDPNGTVTGGGVPHLSAADLPGSDAEILPGTGFAALAPADSADRIVIIRESGAMLWLPATEIGKGRAHDR
ncbi:MAG: hypothetical protein ACRDQ7_24475, partial [Haloechinothrix sp.]